jgi:hypothetical protein
VSFIHQVDFLEVDAILSKTFNQSYDEIYGAEMTFLSKSEGVFVSYLGILMAYGKGEAQQKHGKSTRQSGVWGFHDKHRGMLMMKSVTFTMKVWPCCDFKKYGMEWIGWASKGPCKEPAKFVDEFSPTGGE